jgi:hypothetical protein
MGKSVQRLRRVAAGLAALSFLLAMPVQADGVAGASVLNDSEKLRRLDIMLMVTGLRCRTTADDFQADFQAFEARHLADLNTAARLMVEEYSGQMGVEEANHLVDRLSTRMANRYGNGHPWLGCHELKGLVQSLAQQDGREVLLQAASEIMDGDEQPPVIIAAFAAPPAKPDGAVLPGGPAIQSGSVSIAVR